MEFWQHGCGDDYYPKEYNIITTACLLNVFGKVLPGTGKIQFVKNDSKIIKNQLIKSVIYNIKNYILKEIKLIEKSRDYNLNPGFNGHQSIFNWDLYNTTIEQIKEITHLKTAIDKLKQEKEQSLMQSEDVNIIEKPKLFYFY